MKEHLLMSAPFTPRRTRALGAALAIALAAAAGSATSPWAATPSQVTLKVKGPGLHHPARFCGKRKSVYVFPRGSQLKYKGTVAPAPPKHFPVDIKVERCRGTHFRRVTTLHLVGKRGTGIYKAFFRAPRPGSRARVTYFSAVAVVGGRASNKRYFGIHR